MPGVKDPRRYRHGVEEAKAHRLVRLRVMARRTDYRETVYIQFLFHTCASKYILLVTVVVLEAFQVWIRNGCKTKENSKEILQNPDWETWHRRLPVLRGTKCRATVPHSRPKFNFKEEAFVQQWTIIYKGSRCACYLFVTQIECSRHNML